MSANWPRVPLGEVLTEVSRPTRVEPTGEYRLLGVRLDSAGPFLRETVGGTQTSAKVLSSVETGDLIYSRLFAWRGAFGMIPAELHDCFVSNEFPTFHAHDTTDPRFILLWLRLPETIRAVESLCSGSTPLTRNRLKEAAFLSLCVPLPPVAEQRRIVARVDAIAARVAEARGLREQATAEYDSLLVTLAHRADITEQEKQHRCWQRVRLGEVLRQVSSPVAVRTDESYPNLGIYSFGRGLFEKPPIEGMTTSASTLYQVRVGQFIYSRLFAFEGAYGRVPPSLDGRFVSNEYPTFDCDPGRLRPEFIHAYFRSKSVWIDVATGSKGLGDRRQRVQPEQILNHTIWLPPLAEQDRLVAVEAKADALRALQAETAAELDALVPAVLARAFAGEL